LQISWVRVFEAATLPPNQTRAVSVGDRSVLVAHTADGYFAVENRCSHAGSPLEGGRIRRGAVFCPLHGAPFRLLDGACLSGATPYPPLTTFPVRVDQGWVEVGPSPPPSGDDT